MSGSGDYISRKAAIEEQKRFCGYLDNDMLNRLEIAIGRIPAADVRPVVLCKDCLHENCAMYHGPNWFCADGERMAVE